MAKGTINFTQSKSSGSYIDGKIEWSSVINQSKNTSDVTVELYVRKGNTDMVLTDPTAGMWQYTLNVDGTSASGDGRKSAAVLEDWVLLRKDTVTVDHNANGSKSIEIISSITAPVGTNYQGHVITIRTTVKLDTIDRATKINKLQCSTAYLDGNIAALYTPVGSDLVNRRLVYVNVDDKLTLIRSTDLGSKPATAQTSGINFSDSELSKIYKLVTTTTKVKIRVVFQTYTTGYSTKVGDDQYLEITLTIPAKIAPAASLTITQKNTNAWIAGKKLYVAGLSGVTVGLNYQGADWTTIESRNIIYNGTTYDATALNITALKNAGNIEFTGKVIDSRGRSATATESITVLPYSPPAVTSMSLERGTYDTKWTADDDGEDLRVVFKTTISLSDKGNAYAAAFEIDGTAITPASGATTGLTSGTSCVVYFRGVDSDVSHKLQLTATDSVGKAGAATITVPTAHVTIEFKANGKGIAFGKTSEKDAFECAFPAEFTNTVKRIKENGTVISLDDTGWIDLGISDSVTTTSSANAGHYNGCAYRVVGGNHVYVAFNVRAEYSGSAVTVSGTPIPSEHMPKLQPYAVVTLNGSRVARILVSRSNGHVIIDWIRNVSDEAEPATHIATWIDGYIDYWI